MSQLLLDGGALFASTTDQQAQHKYGYEIVFCLAAAVSVERFASGLINPGVEQRL